VTVVVAKETVLQRERVHHLKLLPDHDSSRAHLASFDAEATRWKTNVLGAPRQQSWQESDLGPRGEGCPLGRRVAPVEEGVLLLAVAVDVAVDQNLLLLDLRDLSHQFLCVEYFGVQFGTWQDPLAIQVYSCK